MPIELPVEFTFPNVAAASQQALRKLGQATKGPNISLKEIAGTATVVAGAFLAAAAAVKAYFDGISDVVDETFTLSKATGLSADAIAGLRQAARATGKELKDIVPVRLAKNLLTAQQGSTELARAFKQAGVAFKDAEGNVRDINDAFPDLLDKLAAMENRTEAAGLAAQLMGKQGRELLSAFDNSAGFDAFVSQATKFGIDVGPKAKKASEGWQKANADLVLSFDFVKRRLLEVTGGQEAWNRSLTNAAVNVIFLTELTAGMFDILFTNIDAAIFNVKALGDAFKKIIAGETDFTIVLKEGLFNPIEGIKGVLNKAANAAIDFRKEVEKTSNVSSGGRGYKGVEDDVKSLNNELEKLAVLFDFSSVLEADVKLSNVLNKQWEAQASTIELINADFDAQKKVVEELVEQGANRVIGAVALAQIEDDRLVALSAESNLLKSIEDIEERRRDRAREALSIVMETARAMQGFANLTTEVWTTNQANNQELDNNLKLLRSRTNEKTTGLELDLESLEAQLELVDTARERGSLETAIIEIKEQIAVVDTNADKQAKRLKKREEKRLEDTFKDIKAFQIASTIAGGAAAAVQAIAQLGPVAGAVAIAGIVATTVASSLTLIRSQSPTFHIGGNPFEDQPLPGFTGGPDERQITVTQNEIQSPADRRQAQQSMPTVFELPIVLSNQVIDTLVFEVASGSGRTGRLLRGGTDVLRRPAFTGN